MYRKARHAGGKEIASVFMDDLQEQQGLSLSSVHGEACAEGAQLS